MQIGASILNRYVCYFLAFVYNIFFFLLHMKHSYTLTWIGLLFLLQTGFLIWIVVSHLPFSYHSSEVVHASALQQLSSEIARISSKVNPALVSIVVKQDVAFYRANPWYSLGVNTTKKQLSGWSGFFVLDGKYILTNAHVVGDTMLDYSVILSDNRELNAKIVWSDPQWTDLALLQVYDDLNKLYTHNSSLDLSSRTSIDPGDIVLAFGNPYLSLPNTVTMGIVSAVDRKITTRSSSKGLIQTDAIIHPGSSWWPLVGFDGRVVGMNTAVIDSIVWVSFATPIIHDDLVAIVERLK